MTSAPIAAPNPIGSRPPCRTTTDAVRGFAFAVRPPPFFLSSSSAARSATRPYR
ncbi:hypothetical protein ABZY09_48040 [Streptomyces sp. NPDC002928]|uniref:hypothetical protein n=1 Tax=Streptomyces sp. NPDC002928 TaxID=3154440 RepID=UPI0033AD4CEA